MANRDNIPRSVVEVVVKMLSCRTKFAGHDEYSCSNSGCNTPKSSLYLQITAMLLMWKKATEQWIAAQNKLLQSANTST
ncbi:hypothetical protein [Piscirickettsia salmonis]|uniref:hypothetical protein n=1 Tax=Piscirickettsia salmonis TaxID=1238 RepID=UPI0018C8A757|nr:hypothetical protein [Piscirickettsia salmonis]